MRKCVIKFLNEKNEEVFQKELKEIPKLRTVKAVMWWTGNKKALVKIQEETKDHKIECNEIIMLKTEI